MNYSVEYSAACGGDLYFPHLCHFYQGKLPFPQIMNRSEAPCSQSSLLHHPIKSAQTVHS
jgi:hypothetical protein